MKLKRAVKQRSLLQTLTVAREATPMVNGESPARTRGRHQDRGLAIIKNIFQFSLLLCLQCNTV